MCVKVSFPLKRQKAALSPQTRFDVTQKESTAISRKILLHRTYRVRVFPLRRAPFTLRLHYTTPYRKMSIGFINSKCKQFMNKCEYLFIFAFTLPMHLSHHPPASAPSSHAPLTPSSTASTASPSHLRLYRKKIDSTVGRVPLFLIFSTILAFSIDIKPTHRRFYSLRTAYI